MYFLNRYIIGIIGSLALVKIIELDSYSCNFTSILAYLITLVFFSALCSVGQTKILLRLCKITVFCVLELLWAIDTIYTKYNVDDFGFEVVFKRKKKCWWGGALSSTLYWILFAWVLCDGFLQFVFQNL